MRQSYQQRQFNQSLEDIEYRMKMRAEKSVKIWLHPDPQYVVVQFWNGDAYSTDGVNCGCTASQYGRGCRHVKLLRDLGGMSAAKDQAEGVWNGEMATTYGKRVEKHVEGAPEGERDARDGDNGGSGGGRRSASGSDRLESVVQGRDTAGVQNENTERRDRMSVSRGYGYEPPTGESGDYLRFGKEPGVLRMRLIGDPIVFVETTDWGKKTCAAWVVLYRNKETQTTELRHFKSGMQIYSQVRNYAMDEDEWGPTEAYDVKITKKGTGKDSEYFVTACPKAALTAEEKQMVKGCQFDLEALYAAPRGQGVQAHDDGRPAPSDDDDPFA